MRIFGGGKNCNVLELNDGGASLAAHSKLTVCSLGVTPGTCCQRLLQPKPKLNEFKEHLKSPL